MGLLNYLENDDPCRQWPLYLFGVCTGGIAALFAAIHIKRVKGVYVWEVCQNYEYSVKSYQKLSDKFGVNVDWDTALTQVQPCDLVRKVHQPICFGMAEKSKCTNYEEQLQLCSLSKTSYIMRLRGVGHVPISANLFY